MLIRPATTDDVDLICHHRELMFREAGFENQDASISHFRRWIAGKIAANEYLGLIATDDEKPVAGVGFMIITWPPHPLHPQTSTRGYILNLFVEPKHRKRGIAHELMNRAESELKRRGASYAILHATNQGRPLYEKMGWSATTEMSKLL